MPDMDSTAAPASGLLDMDSSVAPAAGFGQRLRRALDPRRGGLVARAHVIARENDSAFAFGVRLFAAVALTFALVGALGYVLIDRSLEHRQISNYAAAQRADARGFEDVAAQAASPAEAITQIDRLLDGVARRPGTLGAVLIDQRHVVVAAGEVGAAGEAAGSVTAADGDRLVGTTDTDPRIDAALV